MKKLAISLLMAINTTSFASSSNVLYDFDSQVLNDIFIENSFEEKTNKELYVKLGEKAKDTRIYLKASLDETQNTKYYNKVCFFNVTSIVISGNIIKTTFYKAVANTSTINCKQDIQKNMRMALDSAITFATNVNQ